jgi:hypothetical protein
MHGSELLKQAEVLVRWLAAMSKAITEPVNLRSRQCHSDEGTRVAGAGCLRAEAAPACPSLAERGTPPAPIVARLNEQYGPALLALIDPASVTHPGSAQSRRVQVETGDVLLSLKYERRDSIRCIFL